MKVRMLRSATSLRPQAVVDVASTVTALLEALEYVVESHVDIAEALRAALQSTSDNEAVVSVLEHGLEVLEALSLSSPRKQRKIVDGLCEHVESVVEELDSTFSQLSACRPSELESLVQCLCEVRDLRVGEAGSECTATVAAALEELARCSDPVLGASELVRSAEFEDRMRGLGVLRDLERVVLDEVVESEVSTVSLVIEMGVDGDRGDGERTAGWMSAFVLCFRNCGSAEVRGQFSEGSTFVRCVGRLYEDVYNGRLNGREGLGVWSSHAVQLFMLQEFLGKFASADRGPLEKAFSTVMSQVLTRKCSVARLQEMTPVLMDTIGSSDDMVVAACTLSLFGIMTCSSSALVPVLMSSGVPHAVWEMQCRIVRPGQPASWWKERAEVVHLDTMCHGALGQVLYFIVTNLAAFPQDGWDEILMEAVHLMKVNQAAELSAKTRMPYPNFHVPSALVGKAALDQSRHVSLLANGVAKPLLYAAAHEFVVVGVSISAAAASAAVSLIGRNEGGLTLSREAVDSVLRDFKTFFVPNTRRGNYVSTRPLGVAKAIVNMVISDANKAFVVEHDGAIDALVAGLLLDESHPRRTQEGGEELQTTCALALQNLALSDVGKAAYNTDPHATTLPPPLPQAVPLLHSPPQSPSLPRSCSSPPTPTLTAPQSPPHWTPPPWSTPPRSIPPHYPRPTLADPATRLSAATTPCARSAQPSTGLGSHSPAMPPTH
eukprot:COSAG05_NODE_2544_length_2925_cov_2.423213_2_plen_719_part_01